MCNWVKCLSVWNFYVFRVLGAPSAVPFFFRFFRDICTVPACVVLNNVAIRNTHIFLTNDTTDHKYHTESC